MDEQKRTDQRKATGRLGEELAAVQLEAQGYRIIARNWRCRTGELDIVAEYNNVIAIIEVRTRKASGRFGLAKESIDYRKQKQVRETAQVYIHQHKQYHHSIRFDVMSVELTKANELIQIEHIISAF
ncbi:YraN family protein [Paenibacillus albiflavus]|uniref:UPF0102 protein E0485_03540 n=1 Tax=Paenibacillus albiflavus TaxID=2545760 RepID=A0A4R4ENL6_9BACL|nr:YraN family protein [Paenibacillus albiflavus]TCZ79948.1 YraN family protein [Paenibacillus albiflavus]